MWKGNPARGKSPALLQRRLRGAYHRREYRRAKYEAEVEAHEARMNGHAPPSKKVDLVALGLAKPKPTLGLRPLGAQSANTKDEEQQIT
jgi:hypothetical protein